VNSAQAHCRPERSPFGSNRRTLCARDRSVRRKILQHTFFFLVGASCLFAQQPRPTESQVKAAYLYNFGKFVRWDAGSAPSSDTFDICVLGRDPFGPVLDATVAGESIEGKKASVHKMSSLAASSRCNILFISSSEEGRLGTILPAAQRLNLLTVSDIPRFAERGGTIGFVMQNDRVRFEVNRSAAEQSHLALSSELLKVATRVLGPKS